MHILAYSIGAREAARRLGIKESTLLSWSHRLKWKLPRRKVGRPPLEVKEDPSDVLLDYKRRGGLTRLDMARALAAVAERLAGTGGKGAHSPAMRSFCNQGQGVVTVQPGGFGVASRRLILKKIPLPGGGGREIGICGGGLPLSNKRPKMLRHAIGRFTKGPLASSIG